MMHRAVAWDIDGTLVDSEPRHHRALVDASRAWGVDLADLPDQAFRGVHMLDVWTILKARYPADLSRTTWLYAIERAYVADARGLTPMPGAVEAVRALASLGVPQVCVSNSNRAIVDANLALLGVADCMALTISLDDVTAGKPDPTPYRTARRWLGLPPEAVVAVEDSSAGVRSAKAAGLYAIGFVAAPNALPDADIEIGDLTEVVRLLTREPVERRA